jgi:transketolase
VRSAFIKALFELAGEDPLICLVVGDLGYSVVEEFAEKYPKQFVNAGVAEQDMVGIATGMALSGKIVFTYSIANFATLRCLEQIRNDVCYHGANVKVVAIGGGLAYGGLGMSHHATEDLAILRALPGLVVVAPGDPVEADLATRAVVEHQGPCYLRLGKAGEPTVHQTRPEFRLGRAIWLRRGGDISLISTGGMLDTATVVADALERRGLAVSLISMHTVSPLDVDTVMSAAASSRCLVTLEEHSIVGGLGSAVAEVISERSGHAPLMRVGLPPSFVSGVGDQNYLKGLHGLHPDGIMRAIDPMLEQTFGLVG